ncbi:LysR family substrate-binding domain-containing protein [Cryobacterium tepidiphilum]|uniref:LysR family transcriptional regulator n=1 Tax=Cryobacterium tepidiphilum TaxID=2486026 RepID=A0A3M8LPZ5_9MICO|nr:LysR family substrate-binding domain-containing protein [Cryobacterium tepidiphilum]RNE67415.1 LysR family transcriptional regulator [Cryobacterium tepidiphilum]
MPFSLGFVAGVTPTKWARIWNERRPDVPLDLVRVDAAEQADVLRDGRVDMCLARLPIDRQDLSVIALYREVPVVVAAKDHELAALDEAEPVPVEDLAGEHLLQDPEAVPEWRAVAVEVQDGSRRTLPPMRDLDDAMEQVAAGVGILILPHSLARLHSRKDVVSRPVAGVADTEIALAWPTANTTDDVETFIGIVRGRTAASSRSETVVVRGEPEKKVKKTAKAKEAAKAAREAAGKKSHGGTQKPAPGRTRNAPRGSGKRRGR